MPHLLYLLHRWPCSSVRRVTDVRCLRAVGQQQQQGDDNGTRALPGSMPPSVRRRSWLPSLCPPKFFSHAWLKQLLVLAVGGGECVLVTYGRKFCTHPLHLCVCISLGYPITPLPVLTLSLLIPQCRASVQPAACVWSSSPGAPGGDWVRHPHSAAKICPSGAWPWVSLQWSWVRQHLLMLWLGEH